MTELSKPGARAFLADLESLLKSLPNAQQMHRSICQTITLAKGDKSQRHLATPEAAFLNAYVVPTLYKVICNVSGMNEERAKHALLNEYWRCAKAFSIDSPGRTQYHPFSKVLGMSAESIYSEWTNLSRRALFQSCPDFALRNPFPYKIVFEGKYFSAGSLARARQELVRDIYQTFFYLGLPPVPQTKTSRAEWDYDYACLVAFDASKSGTLRQAWSNLPDTAAKTFWEGGNIYVMILGGDGRD
jgi:hypothetical protein